ncbi:hypothetical protein SKAU_G00430620 [Synaphobranchus kaupii]|uniref:Uncharacterized protein n=1 Tax=Synaphobranchus kaupii TaxID=118154 RepID=A0A9Q1E4N6_SYNKA|nr:hypothetical protein SKAU_G00430620 [Synaphobranchus kaupii]
MWSCDDFVSLWMCAVTGQARCVSVLGLENQPSPWSGCDRGAVGAAVAVKGGALNPTHNAPGARGSPLATSSLSKQQKLVSTGDRQKETPLSMLGVIARAQSRLWVKTAMRRREARYPPCCVGHMVPGGFVRYLHPKFFELWRIIT